MKNAETNLNVPLTLTLTSPHKYTQKLIYIFHMFLLRHFIKQVTITILRLKNEEFSGH